MKTIFKTLIILLILPNTFSSCKGDTPVDKLTQTELLTKDVWRGENYLISENNEDSSELPGFSTYHFSFNTNLDLIIYNDDDSLIINWNYNDTNDSIVINGGGEYFDGTWIIKTITENNLKLERTFSNDENTFRLEMNLIK